MTEEQRQDILNRFNKGMCALSDAQMAANAAEQEAGMLNAWPRCGEALQQGIQNFWGYTSDEFNNFHPAPEVSLWDRFKRWLGA